MVALLQETDRYNENIHTTLEVVVDNTRSTQNTSQNSLWSHINKTDDDLYALIDTYVAVQTDRRKNKAPFYSVLNKRLDEKIDAMPSADSAMMFGTEDENNSDFFNEYIFQISRYCDERRGTSRGWGNSLRVKTAALENVECEKPIRDKVLELGSLILGDASDNHLKMEDRLGCMYEILSLIDEDVTDFEKQYLADVKDHVSRNGPINSQMKKEGFTQRMLPIMRDAVVGQLDKLIETPTQESTLDDLLPAYAPIGWDESMLRTFDDAFHDVSPETESPDLAEDTTQIIDYDYIEDDKFTDLELCMASEDVAYLRLTKVQKSLMSTLSDPVTSKYVSKGLITKETYKQMKSLRRDIDIGLYQRLHGEKEATARDYRENRAWKYSLAGFAGTVACATGLAFSFLPGAIDNSAMAGLICAASAPMVGGIGAVASSLMGDIYETYIRQPKKMPELEANLDDNIEKFNSICRKVIHKYDRSNLDIQRKLKPHIASLYDYTDAWAAFKFIENDIARTKKILADREMDAGAVGVVGRPAHQWDSNLPITELYDGDLFTGDYDANLETTCTIHLNADILTIPDDNVYDIACSNDDINRIHDMIHENTVCDVEADADIFDDLLEFDLAESDITDDVIMLDTVVDEFDSTDTIEHLLPDEDSSRPAWLVDMFSKMEQRVVVPSVGLLPAGYNESQCPEYRA